jgi:hypothetical protein
VIYSENTPVASEGMGDGGQSGWNEHGQDVQGTMKFNLDIFDI